MSDVAIRVEGLGKQYHLGGPREQYSTFRDQIRRWTSLRTLLRRAREEEKQPPFWALKDVSFEVKRGEVVGIIGRNGAGKSTLLKILSRITEPTEGAADIYGRVGSLLEVGTGFHPELTGRENIYLNGAILGMRRTEITRKFDEIVEFAEVEKFIDTPVKHYSSGMYMRLAFAVAAHLEPEILIVDEVLAVGDAQFQKKCLGKMGEVARRGRTVLFVTHNMHAVRSLCARAYVLDSGRVLHSGEATGCVQSYLAAGSSESTDYYSIADREKRCCIVKAQIRSAEGTNSIKVGDKLLVIANCQFEMPTRYPKIGLVLSSNEGEMVLASNNSFLPFEELVHPTIKGTFVCELGNVPLMPGRYRLSIWLGDETGDHEILTDCLAFEVIEHDIWGRGKMPPKNAGNLYWQTRFTYSASEVINNGT